MTLINTWTVDELNASLCHSDSDDVGPEVWSIAELNKELAKVQESSRGPSVRATSSEMQFDAIVTALRALTMPIHGERDTVGCTSEGNDQSALSQLEVSLSNRASEVLPEQRSLKHSAKVAHHWTQLDGLGIPLPLKVRVEPFEDDTLVYLQMAPLWNGAPPMGTLYFYLIFRNDSIAPVIITQVNASLPGDVRPVFTSSPDFLIQPGETRELWFRDAEIAIITGSPTKIIISLTIQNVANPRVLTFKLGPHQVSYPLFAKPENITEHGEYIHLPGDHFGDGGREVFALDTKVGGWANHNLVLSKNDGKSNKDHFVFGRPFYSMKAGKVMYAVDSNKDNPAPKQRAVVKRNMDSAWQSKLGADDIAVAGMTSERILVAWVASSVLMLTVLMQPDLPDPPSVLSETPGPAASSVALVCMTSRLAVTATLLGTTARVTLWEVMNDGSVIERHHTEVLEVKKVKILALSSTRLVVATYGNTLAIALSVWAVDSVKKTLTNLPVGNSNVISPTDFGFDLVKIDETRFVTLASSGLVLMDLSIVVWKFVETQMNGVSTFLLFPFGKGWGGVGERVGVQVAYPDHFGTVIRDLSGILKILIWKTDPNDGVVTLLSKYEMEAPLSLIAAVPFKEQTIAVISRTAQKKLHFTVLNIARNSKTLKITIELTNNEDRLIGDTTSAFCGSLVKKSQPILVTAYRSIENGGIVKLDLWEFTANNSIHVLYGNEVVSFFHVQQGSIPPKFTAGPWPVPVKQGELLGKGGNAGSSSGPHLHIHASRVFDSVLKDELYVQLIECLKNSTMESVSVFRPLQFEHAKVGLWGNVKEGGVKANPQLSDMDGEGGHLFTYAVLPLSDVLNKRTSSP